MERITELFVVVEDRPGALGELLTHLTRGKISRILRRSRCPIPTGPSSFFRSTNTRWSGGRSSGSTLTTSPERLRKWPRSSVLPGSISTTAMQRLGKGKGARRSFWMSKIPSAPSRFWNNSSVLEKSASGERYE